MLSAFDLSTFIFCLELLLNCLRLNAVFLDFMLLHCMFVNCPAFERSALEAFDF